MNQWLETIVLGNALQDYLIFAGALLLAVIFKRFGVKLFAALVYRLLGHLKGGARFAELIEHLKKPVVFLVFILIIYASFLALKSPPAFEEHPVFIMLLKGGKVFFHMLFVIGVVWLIFRIADFIALGLSRNANEEEELNKVYSQAIPFVRDLAKVFLTLTASVFVFGVVFGFNVTSLVAGLGIGGLAIAFAAQETLANLLASFTIFLDKPFRVGDFIQVGEILGVVENIGFRSTRIRTLEKSYLSVPNKKLVDSTVDNLTLRTYRRSRFDLGLTYQTSVEQLKAIVADIKQHLDDHPNTTNDAVVGFHEFGDSSLNIVINYFVDTMDWASYIKIKEGINFAIIEIVEKHGSSIAYPTRTLHMHQDNKPGESDADNVTELPEKD